MVTGGPLAGRPTWRAVRFAEPGLVAIGRPGGLVTGATGRLDMVEGDAAVRQAILMLLTTRIGERVMRPTYGSLLHRLIFSPNDATTAGLAIHYVRQALTRWEPRVEILAIDAGPDPVNGERLVVELRYRVRATQAIGELRVPVPLAETAGAEAAP